MCLKNKRFFHGPWHAFFFFNGSFCKFDHLKVDVRPTLRHQEEHTFFHILINPKQDKMYHL